MKKDTKRKHAKNLAPTPRRRRGRPIALETHLPEIFVMARWGCTPRHARRVLAKGHASPPPWEIVDCMIRAALLVAEGYDPAEIVDGFRESVACWMAESAESAE